LPSVWIGLLGRRAVGSGRQRQTRPRLSFDPFSTRYFVNQTARESGASWAHDSTLTTHDMRDTDRRSATLPRMDIREATSSYEKWMARHIPVVQSDLRLKHARMVESAFAFLRGTFYRWA